MKIATKIATGGYIYIDLSCRKLCHVNGYTDRRLTSKPPCRNTLH